MERKDMLLGIAVGMHSSNCSELSDNIPVLCGYFGGGLGGLWLQVEELSGSASVMTPFAVLQTS